MQGHPVAHTGEARVHVATHFGDDPARFVARDDRLAAILETQRLERRTCRRAIQLEIAAAHARCLDFQNHVARAWRRIGEFDEIEGAVAGEDHAAHVKFLFQ